MNDDRGQRDPDEPLGLTRGQRLQSDMSEVTVKHLMDVMELWPTDKTIKNLQAQSRRIT